MLNKTHITLKSGNAKVGPIPVTTSSKNNCPNSCPMKEAGCYAKGGPLAIHWAAVTRGERGLEWADFLGTIAGLPEGQLWRHNQAGDLQGDGELIDADALAGLVEANKGRKGFTYTHYGMDRVENLEAVRKANAAGFTVNVSLNNLKEVPAAAKLGVPLAVVVPEDHPEKTTLEDGSRVVVCPVQTGKAESCATCKLCQKANRGVVVGFRAHGSQKKKVIAIASIN